MSALGQRLGEASWRGPALAMAAAFLFGASTPLAKLLLARLDPWYLAAVLYLGSGFGLFLLRLGTRLFRPGLQARESLSRSEWPWLAGAILCGGVLGPILLLTGLATTGAAHASLLLNLESVFTALLAWFVFHENVDLRVALGMTAIAAGALVLSWQGQAGPGWGAGGLAGAVAIAGACLAWALDNNLTRKVSLGDPVQIAMLKGLVAGTVNLGLALRFGALHPSTGVVESGMLAGALLGMFSYGLSLVLFVLALRNIGAARTGAYYASAPFIGAVLAVLSFGEPLTGKLVLAGTLMLAGLWLHLTERHEHEHEHPALAHAHRHRHDLHHQHRHGQDDPAGEPHSHRHVHLRLRHSHRHFPDAHHSHGH
jgi:drug/metabolite transporter (DMT)-like permease